MELKLPKLRHGSFFASILERRCRTDWALFAVVMEAYCAVDDTSATTSGGEWMPVADS